MKRFAENLSGWVRKKSLPVLLATTVLIPGSVPVTAYAYGDAAAGNGPAKEEHAGEYDEETLARLRDNVLEYEEIPDLIHLYNTDIQEQWDNFNENKDNSAVIQTELISQARLMRDLKEQAEEAGDSEEVAYYAAQEQSYKSMASRYGDIMEDYEKPSATKSLSVSERQMTKAAQELMISYNTMRLQRDNQEKQREVYEAKYQLAQAKAQAGTATSQEVLSAKNQLLSAESALISLDSSLTTVKSSLCVMTGWPADGDPQISEIPETDSSAIAAWNLEEDTKKAIGNNRTLISQRTEGYTLSTSGIDTHLGVVDQGEQQLTIKMQTLYEDVYHKKSAFDSADAGFQSGSIAKNVADQKYSLGMLSQAEYLEAQLTYLQKKAARDSANISLCQAISAYDWAVQGFTEVE